MATDNVAYYAAEETLRHRFEEIDSDELRRRLIQATKAEGCEFNRILFHYFDVAEESAQ